jgi:hypothetical protein
MTGDIVNCLRTNRECLAPCLMDEAADEIVRLEAAFVAATQERDEARREVCRLSQQAHNIACELSRYPKNAPSPQEYATALGWDCFKENGDA